MWNLFDVDDSCAPMRANASSLGKARVIRDLVQRGCGQVRTGTARIVDRMLVENVFDGLQKRLHQIGACHAVAFLAVVVSHLSPTNLSASAWRKSGAMYWRAASVLQLSVKYASMMRACLSG